MLYFLVYNDNTHTKHIDKLLQSVKTYGPEFNVIVFNKTDMDPEFVNTHKRILECSRGGGYWLWKPYIIHETLQRVNTGDTVFYLDSSYYFIEPFADLYANVKDMLVWKNKPNEEVWLMKNWCKMHVIQKYQMGYKVFGDNAEDCWAGALVLKKTKNTMNYVREWLNMCCTYEDITDSLSKIDNTSFFREHRHDQSLLSIVIHKYGIHMRTFGKKYLQNARRPFTVTG